MRRRVLLACTVEILVWCLSAKSAVWPMVVVEMGEGIDAVVEPIEPMRQVMAGIEFVAP